MKLFALTATLAFIGTASVAETPNSSTMGWREYAEASGCVFVDMGGYLNIRSAADQTDPCPAEVRTAFFGIGSAINAGADGILGTADDYRTSDR